MVKHLKRELKLKGLSDEDYRIVKRLINLKGQLDGVIKMIGDKRDLIDIIVQLKALKGAFTKAGTMYISEHLALVMKAKEEKQPKKIQKKMIQDLINELSRY
ncbi:metal-sensing transcriptional repressor [Patescibacteria group bacterium]|nr:metal-sensing transcriptional repressor [Patescibacteria group bacterium]